jgi:hypothetical protein
MKTIQVMIPKIVVKSLQAYDVTLMPAPEDSKGPLTFDQLLNLISKHLKEEKDTSTGT